MSKNVTNVLLAVISGLLLYTCAENPIESRQQADCGHVDADGLVIESGTTPLLTQWLGTIEGGLEVTESGQSASLRVTFLDFDSNRVQIPTQCADHSLQWTVTDSSVVSLDAIAGERWSFRLSGHKPGITSTRLQVWHGDHADFTSLALPVTVLPIQACDPVEVHGVLVSQNGSVVVSTWNGNAVGGLVYEEEATSTLDVTFLDGDSSEVIIPDSCNDFSLGWDIDNAALVSLSSDAGQRWQLDLEAQQFGSTELMLRLDHVGNESFTSAAIPVDVSTRNVCERVDAAGVSVVGESATIAEQWLNTTTGTINVVDDSSVVLEVSFLALDSSLLTIPDSCTDIQLGWEIGVESLISVENVPDQKWQVRLSGLTIGETTVRLQIWRAGQTDFTSLPLTVEVTEPQQHVPIQATAVALERNCNMLASWNYDEEDGADEVFGYLVVEQGATLGGVVTQWLGSATNVYGARYPLDPSASGYTLDWEIQDDAIAAASLVPGERFAIDLEGLTEGYTEIRFRLQWEGVTELESGWFPIIVRPQMTEPDPASFFITRKGAYFTAVRDGEVLPAPEACGRPLFGYMSVEADSLTDLYSFRLAQEADSCQRASESSSSRYALVFDFQDSCMARVVNHPVHFTEYFLFHLEGLQLGETAVRIHFIDKLLRQVVFTSPALPVEVVAEEPF